MKKQYLWAELAIVFLFLITPPLLTVMTGAAGKQMAYTLSPTLFIEAAIAVALAFQQKLLPDEMHVHSPKKGFARIISWTSWSSITFGGLLLVFTLLQLAAYLLPQIGSNSLLTEIKLPASAREWIVCVLTLVVGAFYEEIMYRRYLCDTLIFLCAKKRWVRLFIESFVILIFAFSHFYLGWPAVVNALLCGILLRLCVIKTDSIIPGATAHFLYNLLMYLLLLFQ